MSKLVAMIEHQQNLASKVATIKYCLKESEVAKVHMCNQKIDITHFDLVAAVKVELQKTEEELSAVTEKIRMIDKLIA